MKLYLAAARDATIPDVLPAEGEPFQVLFCGINPGLYSAATGWHFARPGNRFWPALHLSGFTPRQLKPSEQAELTRYGLGITNIAPRGIMAKVRAWNIPSVSRVSGNRQTAMSV